MRDLIDGVKLKKNDATVERIIKQINNFDSDVKSKFVDLLELAHERMCAVFESYAGAKDLKVKVLEAVKVLPNRASAAKYLFGEGGLVLSAKKKRLAARFYLNFL